MQIRKNIFLLLMFVFILFASQLLKACNKNNDFNDTTAVTFDVPAGFPNPEYNFSSNPLNKETIELGRQLFYEGRLSKDGNYPCASCHNQIAAFTTYDHDLSHGYNHSHTTRNAPALFNLAWLKEFQHDGAIRNLETISRNHITHPNEMAETMAAVVSKLRQDSMYKRLFRAAYGTEAMTGDKIENALKQFLLTMVSSNSKYDQVKKGEESFTVQEQNGYQIFQSKCESCHKEPLFTDLSYRNIGLPLDPFLKDVGRMKVTGNISDSLKFRVPSLRNIMASSYYAHDGRFSTIRRMINHYRSGVVKSATTDSAVENGVTLSETDVDDLISFMRTLTDSTFLKNPKYASP